MNKKTSRKYKYDKELYGDKISKDSSKAFIVATKKKKEQYTMPNRTWQNLELRNSMWTNLRLKISLWKAKSQIIQSRYFLKL